MISYLCKNETYLSEEDILYIEKVSENLQYTADLTNSDVFIDCLCRNGSHCIVVSHARPSFRYSSYERNVVGSFVEKNKEPAVFNAFEAGMPCRDLKAITQEGKTVMQDVVPIKNSKGNIVAVLIAEVDITSRLSESRKFSELAKTAEEYNQKQYGLTDDNDSSDSSVTVREIHHRIKNNLQMVASILNIQANRCSSYDAKKALKESVNRVLSISSIHDILTNKEINGEVSIQEIIKKIVEYSRKYSFSEDANIEISLEGDDILLSPDTATSIAIVVNELISNSIIHGFENREIGNILIIVKKGSLNTSVTICDNGCGFVNSCESKKSVGLRLVQEIVTDKLKGCFTIASNINGTTAKFDFNNV